MKIKIFAIDDEKGISKFIETHRPAGETPFKYNEKHFFVFYEDEEIFNKFSKLQLLHRNLKEIQIRILESRKEIAFTEAEIDWEMKELESIKKQYPEANKYKDDRLFKDKEKLIQEQKNLVFSKTKNIEMEQAHEKGLRKIILEVEKEK